MDAVNKTLYIPLYAKSEITKKGIILSDPNAVAIWNSVEFPLKRKSRSKWLTYYMAMRARVIDDWTRMQTEHNADAVVLHVGAGLDSRVMRVGATNMWYDIDLEDVIRERRRYYDECDSYKMLVGDVRNGEFLKEIADGVDAIVILEGVSMYVRNSELCTFFDRLYKKFKSIAILMDVYTPLGAKMSKFHNPINAVGVHEVYGVESAVIPVSNNDIKYLAEHSMTPQNLVDELAGMDRWIFSHMYAGNLAHKMHALYEYRLER